MQLKSFSKCVFNTFNSPFQLLTANFHSSAATFAWTKNTQPWKFIGKNGIIYPPQQPDEPRRPAFICHQKTNIKYSADKMWYIAVFIRGMSVDEALKQLTFVLKKGAHYIVETIKEAQELAVQNHNVEFKSNLWISESFSTKGEVIKGLRRHAKGRMGLVHYRYCHYFLKLEEGSPPADYYGKNLPTPQKQLDNWLEGMRRRKIIGSL